jgi:hypothetical protein
MEEQEIRIRAYEMALSLVTRLWESRGELTTNRPSGVSEFFEEVRVYHGFILTDIYNMEEK